MTTQPSTESTHNGDAPIIELQGLTKSYGKLHALKGVDLSVERGALYGFLGPNGAGKTTAMRVMTGFIQPGEGTAKVLGLDAWKDSVAIKTVFEQEEEGKDPGVLQLDRRLIWADACPPLRLLRSL